MKKLMFLCLASIWLLQSCKKSDETYFGIHKQSSTTVIENGSWIRKADFGFSRSFTVGFSIGDKGYIGTGAAFDTAQKDFWEYDPVSDTWTQKADFAGVARTGAVGFSIGDKGYIGTGYGNQGFGVLLKDFWEYSPATNCWTRKADFKGTARYSAVGLSIGDKGYIGTGSDGSDRKDFWEYNPKTNKWSARAEFPGRGRTEATGFTIGDKGYVGTGYSAGFNSNEDHRDFWEYDPAMDSWAKKADLGGPKRYSAVSFSLEGFGYVGTGNDDSGELFKDIWEYNPLSDSWVQKADYSGDIRSAATGLSIGNKGYIGFGTDNQDFWQFSRN